MSLLLSVLLLAGSAASAEPSPYRPLSVQLGAGNRYGLVGVAGAWRFHPRFAAVVGVGPWGPSAAARGYYWRGLYGQLGATPLVRLTEDSHTLYGPDISTGIDLRHQRVSFTAGIGAGAILLSTGLKVGPTMDLGVGVNFGTPKGEGQ